VKWIIALFAVAIAATANAQLLKEKDGRKQRIKKKQCLLV